MTENRLPVDIPRCLNLPFERLVLTSIANVRSLPTQSYADSEIFAIVIANPAARE